jgi:hypothetical protein
MVGTDDLIKKLREHGMPDDRKAFVVGYENDSYPEYKLEMLGVPMDAISEDFPNAGLTNGTHTVVIDGPALMPDGKPAPGAFIYHEDVGLLGVWAIQLWLRDAPGFLLQDMWHPYRGWARMFFAPSDGKPETIKRTHRLIDGIEMIHGHKKLVARQMLNESVGRYARKQTEGGSQPEHFKITGLAGHWTYRIQSQNLHKILSDADKRWAADRYDKLCKAFQSGSLEGSIKENILE